MPAKVRLFVNGVNEQVFMI